MTWCVADLLRPNTLFASDCWRAGVVCWQRGTLEVLVALRAVGLAAGLFGTGRGGLAFEATSKGSALAVAEVLSSKAVLDRGLLCTTGGLAAAVGGRSCCCCASNKAEISPMRRSAEASKVWRLPVREEEEEEEEAAAEEEEAEASSVAGWSECLSRLLLCCFRLFPKRVPALTLAPVVLLLLLLVVVAVPKKEEQEVEVDASEPGLVGDGKPAESDDRLALLSLFSSDAFCSCASRSFGPESQ